MAKDRINVLIITGGNTPQVVTETIWALARREHDRFIPDRLLLAITAGVRRRYDDELLNDGGKLDALCTELGIPLIRARDAVRVPYDEAGKPIEDIRSDADAQAFGTLVAELVRIESADPRTRIHLSLAGGRKTMSFHGGAAMSLFARLEDRLSHVLVQPPDREGPKFWWPTNEDETIDLADIPFVRMRDRLPSRMLTTKLDYKTYVEHAQAALRPTALELVPVDRLVRISDAGGLLAEFQLPNLEFALFQLMAEAAQGSLSGAGPDGIGHNHKGWLAMAMFKEPQKFQPSRTERLRAIYDTTFHEGTDRVDDLANVFAMTPNVEKQKDRNQNYISQHLSDLRDVIEAHLQNEILAARFGAPRNRMAQRGRFGLLLAPKEIVIREDRGPNAKRR